MAGKRGRSGRKPNMLKLDAFMQERGQKAASFLETAMNNPDCPWEVRVKAAIELLQQIRGKPAVRVHASGPDDGPIQVAIKEIQYCMPRTEG